MPLHKVIYLSNNTKLYLWKITEDFATLSNDIRLKDSSIARLESMKSESHKKGFLSVRKLLEHIDYTDFDLYYDEYGKPNLKPQGCSIKEMHISISHSHDFSAIAISEQNIGIDIEILKEKIIKIAPKFMDVSHINNLNLKDKIEKATVIWGIKESIFKIKNEPGISFPNHIFEDNFNFEDKEATAKLKFKNKVENFAIQFDSFDGYMFVCAFENN
jgi:phosphopantetheinyl transferase